MSNSHTVIFDIGKTNKKVFVFDDDLNEVFFDSKRFKEIHDDDGFPSDPIMLISNWVISTFHELINRKDLNIKKLNFSAYGASLVYLDQEGVPILPFYNYLKPFPTQLKTSFINKYGPQHKLTVSIGSNVEGMLNSGLQLYRLKYQNKISFEKVRQVLHLPQYFSFLFTQISQADYSSIGCHTALWDFNQNNYQEWLTTEGLLELFPRINEQHSSEKIELDQKVIEVGCGVHDSSSALYAISRYSKEDFMLLSTGTWCVAMNPNNHVNLSYNDIKDGAINYLSISGKPVSSARIMLGKEYEFQVEQLENKFKKSRSEIAKLKFRSIDYQKAKSELKKNFSWKYLNNTEIIEIINFETLSLAYHKLVFELVMELLKNLKSMLNPSLKNINLYIEGGFVKNEVFIQTLCNELKYLKLFTMDSINASAIGAALLMDKSENMDNKLSELLSTKIKYIEPNRN